jgi:hypothetical protein
LLQRPQSQLREPYLFVKAASSATEDAAKTA